MAEMPKMKSVIADGLKAGMARPAARMTDTIGHGPPSGMIMFGTPMVIIGGQIAARLGDPVECKVHGAGNITMGSVTVIIAGACAARMGDPTACCAPGLAGQGAAPVAGAPGSFSFKTQDSLLHGEGETNIGKTKVKWSGDLQSADAEWKGGGGGVGGGGSAAVAKGDLKIEYDDKNSDTFKTGGGTGGLNVDMLAGSDGTRTGYYQGATAQLTGAEGQVDRKRSYNFWGYDVEVNDTTGASAGSVGAAYGGGAYHDSRDDRVHIVGLLDVDALIGAKLGFDISFKKSAPGSSGSGSPGAGAAGLAGTITSGCMTVLIGG